MPFSSYWTTNYDTLIEQSLDFRNINYNKIVVDKDLRKNDNNHLVWLYKMHGDVNNYNSVVITKQDYENYYDNYEMVLAKLKSEICTKTFLFLGYSISDPNIMHILARARKVFDKNNGRKHYAIMESPKKIKNGKKNTKYNYEIIKQQHQIKDYLEYGIEVILVDDYSVIDEMLKAISRNVYKKNILFSGAYENDTKNADKINQLVQNLSSWLITKNYKIFTGYGKNIGQHIVNGAFHGCELKFRDDLYQNKLPEVVSINQRLVNNFNSNVFIFPFPYDKTMSNEQRKSIYTDLRENMIASTTISIIICGEKYLDDRDSSQGKINSQGVKEEYEISLSHGNYIIPISCTGGIAEEIWKELHNSGINDAFYKSDNLVAINTIKRFDKLLDILQNTLEQIDTNGI